ncbi:MAG TPA: phage tail protein [Steroidobacter sp.]|uniref:phage tail protein n=1 Tax=Steroidobacter sp. TaxID=1978227 RepID=UPI002ED8610D
MPQVIPLIIQGIGAYITGASVVGLTLASTIAVGIYEYDRAKSKARDARNAYNESLQDRILTVRSAIAPREYLLGTLRKGGTLVYAETVGPDSTSLDSVTAICCNNTELVAYYIGDDFLTPAQFPGEKYGRAEVQDNEERFTSGGSGTRVFSLALNPIPESVEAFERTARGDHRRDVTSVVNNEVTVAGILGNGSLIFIRYRANSGEKLRIQYKSGSSGQTVTNWDVATTPGWTAEHRLRGVTYIRTLMLWDETIYANGAPPISGVFRGLAVEGHPFYDPRTGTGPVYTDNPAILAAWYMTMPRSLGGCGIPASWINWSWVSAAANVCDELIEVRSLTPGGPNEFVKRYQCHTVISTARDPLQNLQQILSAMNGRYAFTAGEYRIVAGAFRAATRTLTMDDIAGDEEMQIITVSSEDDPPNLVTAQFADAAKNWAETSPQAVRNDAYITADGAEIPLDVKLPATTDARQANYLQGVMLETKRPAFGVSLAVGGIGEDIAIFDTLAIDLPDRPTYAGKTYEVLNTLDRWNGKFRLTLAEIRPQTWALDATRFTPRNPVVPPDLSYLWDVPPITGLAVELGEPQILPDGNAITQVELTWDAVTALYIGAGGRIEIRYAEAGGQWIYVAPVPGDSTGTTITASLVEESNYVFQVRLVNSIGATSRSWTQVWVEVEGIELAVGVAGPGIFTWANPVGVDTTSSSITKTTTSAAWDAGAHSLQSYTGGCFVSARVGQLSARRMIALNSDPAVDAGYLGLDYALHTHLTNILQVYESGLLVSSHGAITEQTLVTIKYNNADIVYEKDGTPIRTVAAGANRRFFMDTSLYEVAATLVDIAFGPMGGIGPQGLPGANAQAVRLSASSQAFTYDGSGAASPGGQSITFTVVRQNIAAAAVWTAVGPDGLPVTLTGSGDTRTLTLANFGTRSWARVRAEAGGFFDEITVVRLTQGANGANAIQAFLTNQNHTLAANPDGVVGSYANANGRLFVYEGTTDVTAGATLSIQSQTGCTVQINTAANTPVSGQPKGFYRVTAITADQAQAVLRAVYGSITRDLPLTLTRAREGQPGDGQNMLPIGDWVVGTTGSQGPGGRWSANGTAAESAIVLGGAGIAPLGPFGTSEVLWECRPDGANDGDGGWNVTVSIDHRRTYRSTVWFRINQSSGSFYHGCSLFGNSDTLNLDGTVNSNPYFTAVFLPGAQNEIRPNRWYLSVGIIHGSGYTGGYSGVAGIYDPETGRRVIQGTEYKNATTSTAQTHRCYHFYNANASTRQWMPKPRFEEVNGSEPSIDALLAFQRSTPWIETGNCYASTTSFFKIGGTEVWGQDAVHSALSYRTFHLQWKPGTLNAHYMVGANSDPGADASYASIDFAPYRHPGGLQIYESGLLVGDFGACTLDTEIGMTGDGSFIRYYKDRTLIRTVACAAVPYGLDSAFYSPGSQANNVRFGPGTEFESISTGEIAPNAATELAFTSAQQISGNSPDTTNYWSLNLVRAGGDLLTSGGGSAIFTGPIPFNCIAIVTANFTASASLGSVTVYPYLRNLGTGVVSTGSQYGFRQLTPSLVPATVQGQFILTAGQSYEIGVKKLASAINLEEWREPLSVNIEYIKR